MALQCATRGSCGLKGGAVECEVDRLANALSIPGSLNAEARRICSTTVEGRLVKRQPLHLIAASSLYAACREKRAPVTLKELATLSGSEPHEIGRYYKRIVGAMGIAPPVPNGRRYVDRVAMMAGVTKESKKLAEEVERKAVEAGFENGSPMGVAAAAIYVACLIDGEVKTQSDIAEAAGVSVVSLRESAKAIGRLVGVAGFRKSKQMEGAGSEPHPSRAHRHWSSSIRTVLMSLVLVGLNTVALLPTVT